LLWPEVPIDAAKMRLKMEDFGKLMGAIFGVIMTRAEDEEKIKALGEAL
jgi:hypothetical protein